MRRGFGRKVVIVVSEEMMSLYAANNVARAVRNYASNGVALCGLVANLRDPAFREGEFQGRCLVEIAPDSKVLAELERVASRVLAMDPSRIPPPDPMGEADFDEASRMRFAHRAAEERRAEAVRPRAGVPGSGQEARGGGVRDRFPGDRPGRYPSHFHHALAPRPFLGFRGMLHFADRMAEHLMAGRRRAVELRQPGACAPSPSGPWPRRA